MLLWLIGALPSQIMDDRTQMLPEKSFLNSYRRYVLLPVGSNDLNGWSEYLRV